MSNVDEREEFERFFRQHHADIRRWAVRATRPSGDADADDLVQDVFERALRAYDRFRPGSNGLAWLLTIGWRLYFNRCRRNRRRSVVALDEGSLPAAELVVEHWWLSLGIEEIKEDMRQLRPRERACLEGHVLHGQSYRELAQAGRVRRGTIASRLHRARAQLRARLQAREPKAM